MRRVWLQTFMSCVRGNYAQHTTKRHIQSCRSWNNKSNSNPIISLYSKHGVSEKDWTMKTAFYKHNLLQLRTVDAPYQFQCLSETQQVPLVQNVSYYNSDGSDFVSSVFFSLL